MSATPGAARQAPQRIFWLLAALVAVAAAWSVHPVADFAFVAFDDDVNIIFNPHLGPPGSESLAWMWTDTAQMRRYVPLGWAVFSVGYWLTGLSPEGYHALGIVLHVLNAVLVLGVLRQVLARYAGGMTETRRHATAAIAALVWAWHPMRAETAAWSSGLLYGLSGAFALASVGVYLRSLDSPNRGRWVCGAWGLFTLSLLSYPMSLGLAGVFVVIDLAERRLRGGPRLRWVVEKALFVLPALAAAAVAWLSAKHASAMWTPPSDLIDGDLLRRLGRTAAAAGYYLWRPWWPVGLTPAPTLLLPGGAGFLPGWLVLAATAAIFIGWRRTRRTATLLLGAHLSLLAPVLGWTERLYYPADRYGYLAGVVLVVGIALASARLPGRLAAGLGILSLACLLPLQRAQIAVWRETDALLAHIVRNAEQGSVKSFYARWWMDFHLRRGQWEQARTVVTKIAHQGSGEIAADLRQSLAAAERESLSQPVPAVARTHHQLALDFARQGRPIEAEEHFRAALRTTPQFSQAAFNFALHLVRLGRFHEAAALYSFHVAPAPLAEVPVDARRHFLGLLRAHHLAAGNAAQAAALDRALARL